MTNTDPHDFLLARSIADVEEDAATLQAFADEATGGNLYRAVDLLLNFYDATEDADRRLLPPDAEWWMGNREQCPRCGSTDCGTCGDSNSPADSSEWNRTDWDLADIAYCVPCGWESIRSLKWAEDEHLAASETAERNGDAERIQRAHRTDVLRFRAERREYAKTLTRPAERLSA